MVEPEFDDLFDKPQSEGRSGIKRGESKDE